ncbi:MAG: alpha/beta hydrolase, partial [Dehalococcoidales bacterium]
IVGYDLGYISKANYIQNYEMNEYSQSMAGIKPSLMVDGLAVYERGEGDPVLLFPYPHADTEIPMAYSKLADILVGLGRKVISFDPPGAFYSVKTPTCEMDEMLESAGIALSELGIDRVVDVVGHSMSSLCALAFAIKYPERVKNLILIGSMSGFPAAIKHGMPGSTWKWTDLDYWKVMYWGLKLTNGRGSVAVHKKLSNLMGKASFHDESFHSELEIRQEDYTKGVPIRRTWSKNMWKNVDYSDQLSSVKARTLICVGRFDTQTPLELSEDLHKGINNATLLIFENSGHAPFIEEENTFREHLEEFLCTNG